MALVSSHSTFGNLKVYDVRSVVNVHHLKPDFNSLKTDKYISEGYRKKHIIRLKYENKKYVKLPLQPLVQSSRVNPTHGNIEREYPEIVPSHPETYRRILNMFVKAGRVPDGGTILMQTQRVICNDMLVGQPSVEGWHRDGVESIGILCVDRHNIKGGVNEFMNSNQKVIQKELSPGYFAVFDDRCVKHRVTPIMPFDTSFDHHGYRDVVLLAYPAYEITYDQ